jgi:hypothetical protein
MEAAEAVAVTLPPMQNLTQVAQAVVALAQITFQPQPWLELPTQAVVAVEQPTRIRLQSLVAQEL